MLVNKLTDSLNTKSREVTTISENSTKIMMKGTQGKGKGGSSKRVAFLTEFPELGPIPFAGIRARRKNAENGKINSFSFYPRIRSDPSGAAIIEIELNDSEGAGMVRRRSQQRLSGCRSQTP